MSCIFTLENAMHRELEVIQAMKTFLQHGVDPSQRIPEWCLYYRNESKITHDAPKYSLREAIRKHIDDGKDLYAHCPDAVPHGKLLFFKAIEQWEEVAQLASEKLAEFTASKEAQGPQEAQIPQETLIHNSQIAGKVEGTDAQVAGQSSTVTGAQKGTEHGDAFPNYTSGESGRDSGESPMLLDREGKPSEDTLTGNYKLWDKFKSAGVDIAFSRWQ